MRQHRLDIVTAASLVALWLSPLAAAQTAVVNSLYEANAWHMLTCERDHQCSWFVRRGGPSNPFQLLQEGNLVQEGPYPAYRNIFLNEETKGTYRCFCRMDGGEVDELRKEVYFYSGGRWAGGGSTGCRCMTCGELANDLAIYPIFLQLSDFSAQMKLQ